MTPVAGDRLRQQFAGSTCGAPPAGIIARMFSRGELLMAVTICVPIILLLWAHPAVCRRLPHVLDWMP
jgi:hypothetical protein